MGAPSLRCSRPRLMRSRTPPGTVSPLSSSRLGRLSATDQTLPFLLEKQIGLVLPVIGVIVKAHRLRVNGLPLGAVVNHGDLRGLDTLKEVRALKLGRAA